MNSFTVCAVLALLLPVPALADPAEAPLTLTRQLLQGCLAEPSAAGTAALAASLNGAAYSRAQVASIVGEQPPTVVADGPTSTRAMRSEYAVTAVNGWTLPNVRKGSIEYLEGRLRQHLIDRANGKAVTPTRISRHRVCHTSASAPNGRAVFELYETLHDHAYGMLVSADRRSVIVFVFDRDQHDIELSLSFRTPFTGVAAAAPGVGMSRLVLADGGPRFLGGVHEEVPVATLARAQLLGLLDQAADVSFTNTAIEPVD